MNEYNVLQCLVTIIKQSVFMTLTSIYHLIFYLLHFKCINK